MQALAREFKEFVSRGNVVDLAVAVVIGTAFAAVVTSFVDNVLMPIVAAIVGEPTFDELAFGLGDAEVHYGRFLTALIYFVIVAAAVFLVVKAVNSLQRMRRAQEDEASEAEITEIELLTQIRDALNRDID